MTDLLTPRMPDDLHHALFVARVELLHEAQDINDWLETFFEETWAECHRTHTVPTFKMVKGERVDFTVEVDGTPHFNEFDRRANRYAKRVAKLRWQLWDIKKATKDGAGETQPGRVTDKGAAPAPSLVSQASEGETGIGHREGRLREWDD